MALNKIDIYLHHVLYEISEYTANIPALCLSDKSLLQLFVNMYWEHMAVHARNLIIFFTKRECVNSSLYNNYKSDSCEKDYKKAISDLNQRVSHISPNRTEKFDWYNCILEINKKLLPEIEEFLINLNQYCINRLDYYCKEEEDKNKIKEYMALIHRIISSLPACNIGIRFFGN